MSPSCSSSISSQGVATPAISQLSAGPGSGVAAGAAEVGGERAGKGRKVVRLSIEGIK
jgi:hypothetical protein